jgi:two-component system, LuxR family, sensor kinase FixL
VPSNRLDDEAAVLREARAKAALLASIVDSSDDAITSVRLDGTILSWNLGAERMFGYRAEEVIGQNLLLPEEARGEEEYIVAQMVGGKPLEHLETVRQRKDGSKIDVSITASPVRDEIGGIVATCRIVRDITARKQAEQEIANNSMRLKVMIDSTLDGLITIDSNAMIQSLNASAERMFGFTREEAIGRNLGILTPDPFRTVNDGYSASDLKIGEVKIIGIGREVTGQRKDGTVFPMDLTVSAFRAGNESGLVGIVRDITARKLAEQNSALLLASVVASSDDGIISKTLSGIITSWNTSAERMFGFNARQAIGQHISIIVPPDKIEEEVFILERLNRGEEIQHFETVRIGMNGQRIPVEINVSPVRDGAGRLTGASKILRHVTGRTVKPEHHQAGAKLRAVLDHSVDGLITIDARGNMESFNPACNRIFGYESEEVIGKNIKMLMPEPYRSGHDGYLSHYSATGEAHIIGTAGREVSGRRKDGSVFPMDLSVCVFELGDGKHYSGIIRDNTARKAVEAERERIAAELARYTSALERSNQELDAFAYAASHDLKASLRVIHNASTWIEEDLKGNLTAEIRENMTLLRSRVRRMDRLLDDLLEYSRIGRETDNSHVEAISGAALMENILGLLSPPQGFIVSATSTFAGIEVFRMPLQQILINLISNSIKHHDKKAGRIEVSVEDHFGAMFLFSVKDDGPGIPAQYHEQVFKMFQTLKPRDQVEGSGMGLAMVRKHVDVAGGELKLESTVGQGSTFSFTWPKQASHKI